MWLFPKGELACDPKGLGVAMVTEGGGAEARLGRSLELHPTRSDRLTSAKGQSADTPRPEPHASCLPPGRSWGRMLGGPAQALRKGRLPTGLRCEIPKTGDAKAGRTLGSRKESLLC